MEHEYIEREKLKEEKEQRRKLYQENPKLYRQKRTEFVYGVSRNFKQKKKNRMVEMKQLEEKTMEAYKEGECNE